MSTPEKLRFGWGDEIIPFQTFSAKQCGRDIRTQNGGISEEIKGKKSQYSFKV